MSHPVLKRFYDSECHRGDAELTQFDCNFHRWYPCYSKRRKGGTYGSYPTRRSGPAQNVGRHHDHMWNGTSPPPPRRFRDHSELPHLEMTNLGSYGDTGGNPACNEAFNATARRTSTIEDLESEIAHQGWSKYSPDGPERTEYCSHEIESFQPLFPSPFAIDENTNASRLELELEATHQHFDHINLDNGVYQGSCHQYCTDGRSSNTYESSSNEPGEYHLSIAICSADLLLSLTFHAKHPHVNLSFNTSSQLCPLALSKPT